jgi:hypothetical protein
MSKLHRLARDQVSVIEQETTMRGNPTRAKVDGLDYFVLNEHTGQSE